MISALRKHLLSRLLAGLLGTGLAGAVLAEDLFEIRQIEVNGNTLLSAYQIREIVTPFVGKDKGFGDIQRALEALEGAYRKAGYNAVQVITPEQELTAGLLRLEVRETPIGNITVRGNQHFSEANIRATLPSLQEGKTPNARQLSENIQLANENPAKQIDVVLAVSKTDPSKLDATVNVEDEAPLRTFINADNTGTEVTGRHRLGIAVRHSNLWDSDHTATFAYTGSPDQPDGTKVDIYSAGYRFPLYAFGDSIDVFYAKSNVNTAASTFTLGAFENLTGKGEVYGLRWNHYFQRRGEWSSKLVSGWDIKSIDAECTGPNGQKNYLKGQSAGCTPYTTRPLGLTYSGTWQRPGAAADFSIGAAYNVATGQRHDYTTVDSQSGKDRYSLVSSNRSTRDDFTVIRLGGSYSRALPADWIFRLAATAQSSLGYALPPVEQIGLAGSQAVRGFNERIVAADAGYVANIELHAPDIAPTLRLPGNLRPLVFLDTARGYSYDSPARGGISTETEPAGIMSAGLGLRYDYRKDVAVRLDVASVLTAGPAEKIEDSTKTHNGDWRGHFNIIVGF
ncbi:MAG: ShlB/FhaC/HecB family hemolysin secretion/activation protein [Rhodocyclaceae bacterium]